MVKKGNEETKEGNENKENNEVKEGNEEVKDSNEEVKKNKDDKKKLKPIHKFFLVLSVVVVIGIVSSLLVFEDARITGWVILGNDFAPVQQICKGQCEIQNITNYCCKARKINEDHYTCGSDILKTNCELDCEGVCESYCPTIKSMIPCAKSGCSWLLRGNGYCTTRTDTIKGE